MKSLLAIIILLTITSCSQRREDQHKQEPVDKFIEQKIMKSGVVGLAAAIIIDNKVVWSKGYGYADKENKAPLTPKTIMNIAPRP